MSTTLWLLLILFILLLAFSWPSILRKMTITRWRKTLDLDKHELIFQQLFADVDGFSLSRQARASQDAMEYVYGEIDFISFIALLSLTNPGPSSVFYDLGSGTGKAVLACAMVFNVQKSGGIELFKPLHIAALIKQQQLQQLEDYLLKGARIHLINDDFLQTDFRDATHIFINPTAFFGETWAALNQRLNELTTSTTVITTSKKLVSAAFIVIKNTKVKMSWGIVNAYVHQKVI